MMLGTKELLILVEVLEKAEPCELHGKEHLQICIHCEKTVQCMMCEDRSCQCWNDE